MKKIIVLFFLIMTTIFAPQAWAKEKNINDYVNIAFTIDNNYPIFTMLVIESILENKNPDTEYNFYVLENNITFINKGFMRLYAKYKKTNLTFYRISTESFDEGKKIYTYLPRITPIGMARILLPSVLPQDLKRVLYLDADTLVTTDLKELYNTDLKGNYAGMIRNDEPVNYKDFKFGKNYCNSGVILIDLDAWRKNDIEKKMTEYLKSNLDKFIYKKTKDKYPDTFMYPDQDLINIVLRNKIKILDDKWNAQHFSQNSYITKNFKGIIHFIGPGKPWLAEPFYTNAYVMWHKNWNNSILVVYKPIHMYKCTCIAMGALYKDILKLYKNET